jgi:hypothetical protein
MQSDDVRSFFDRAYLGVWELCGREVTVTISRVVAGDLVAQGNRKSKKPIVYFEKTEKGLVLNKTMMKAIAGLYGYKASDWIGKRITLYPTTTSFGSETVDCIRVRPTVPKTRSQGIASQQVDQAVRSRQERARDSAERAYERELGPVRDADPDEARAAVEEAIADVEPVQ